MTALEVFCPASPVPLGDEGVDLADQPTAGVESVKVPRRADYVSPRHGTVAPRTCYNNGCRHPDCRTAATAHHKRWRVQTVRHGASMVDRTPLVKVLDYAVAAGVALLDVDRAAGVSEGYCERAKNGRRAKLRRDYVDRILKAVGQLVVSRRELLDDVESAVLFARGRKEADAGRWPTSVLRDKVVAEYGALSTSIPNGNMLRNLYKAEWLSSETADKYAAQLGWTGEEVWGDEFLNGREGDETEGNES